jgi:hypothetical protein
MVPGAPGLPRFQRLACQPIATALALLLAAAIPASATSTAARVVVPISHYRVVGPARVIDPRHLATARRGAHPALPPRAGLRSRAAFKPGQARTQGVYTSVPAPSSLAAAPLAVTGAALESLVNYDGITQSSQLGLFGQDQALEPPDTQIAAGPGVVFEMVNASGTVFSTSTAVNPPSIVASVDLNVFFGVPNGYGFADPRVLYDALSGRWIASGAALDPNLNSQIYLAISMTSDPTGPWVVYTIAGNTDQVAMDQPKVGVSSDKVVVSWSDLRCPSSSTTCSLVGQETDVAQKSDMLAGAAYVPSVYFGPDPFRPGIVPVQSLTATNTEYLVYNNSDPALTGRTGLPTLGMVALQGTPIDRNVSWTESDLGIAGGHAPPTAHQPNGVPILTDDDRLLSAAWQDGVLWASGNDACSSGGVTYACARFIQAHGPSPLTPTDSMSVMQDFDRTTTGGDWYYPAVTMDGANNMIASLNESSAAEQPSVITLGQKYLAPVGTATASVLLFGGQSGYNSNTCSPNFHNSWGDYSGVATDPLNRMDVWAAGEFTPGPAANVCNWEAGFSRVTMAAPTVTSICPDHPDPLGASKAITVTGTDFVKGATTAKFGPTAATTAVDGPTSLIATDPGPPNGATLPASVPVTVTTQDGQSDSASAPQYSYDPPTPPYSFSASPVFCQGQIAGGNSLNLTLTVTPATRPAYLSFTSASCGLTPDGGSATAQAAGATGAPVALTSTPMLVPADVNGKITITYKTPSPLPPSGTDAIKVQDALTSPTATAQDSYSFATAVGQYAFSPSPIPSSTAPGQTVSVGLTVQDAHHATIACDDVYLAFTPTRGGGTASVGSTALTPVPARFHTDNGQLTISYTAPTAFPPAGTDVISAQDAAQTATSAPTVANQDTFTILGGYWLAASDGGIFTFGNAKFLGSTGSIRLNKPVVGIALTPAMQGYWLAASDGGIFTFGDAKFLGSEGGTPLTKPVVAMAATPSGKGYWLVASDGGIFTHGDATFFGSMGGHALTKPIVGMARTPSGLGYWLVASDGGLFTFGDAAFLGSEGGVPLNKPVTGMAPTPTGKGYWLVASDGGIFTFGDATFFGSTGDLVLNKPVVGMSVTRDDKGYWLVASDGGIFTFGDAPFLGSTGSIALNKPVVGMAAN